MATLEENIKQAISDFDDVKAALKEQGVDVPSGTNTSEYGNLVRQIPRGGGGLVDQTYDPTSQNAQSGIAVAEAVENKLDKIPLQTEDLAVENNEVSYTLQNPLEKVLLYPYWSESVGADAIYIYIDDVEYECFHSELRVHTLPEDLYTYEHWASGKGTIEKEEIENIWKPGAVIRAERVTAATVQMEDGYMKHSELPELKQETVNAVLSALPTWEGGSY